MRDYAAQKGLDEDRAIAAGMKEKAEEFKRAGGKIYQEISRSPGAGSEEPVLKAAPKD